jgi:DNA polymerase kappa
MDGEVSAAASRAARAIYVFANEKGGMAGIDQTKINSIILELSRNSAYTRRQLKQDAKVDARIALIRRKLSSQTDAARKAIALRVEHRTRELEQTRQLDRVCVVVDFGALQRGDVAHASARRRTCDAAAVSLATLR